MTHHATVTAPLTATADGHAREVAQGERFEFGDNWTRFLAVLDEPRIAAAERALQAMLEMERLDGLSFLDVGSGSGLSSLAARRLGTRVTSFDYDPQSVACTGELARRYFPGDPSWTIQRRSVLDRDALAALGTFDIVYSWGVLHHTGQMWDALQNVIAPVKPGGRLFIAIYNDTGTQSRRWRRSSGSTTGCRDWREHPSRLPSPCQAKRSAFSGPCSAADRPRPSTCDGGPTTSGGAA